MIQPSRGHGRFRALWAATAVSSVGDGMVLVAFPLLALRLTRNPVAIAAVVVFGRLAALVVALPAGAIVDRVDRRRLVMAVEMSRAVCATGFGAAVVLGYDSLPLIYATVFVMGGMTVALDVIAAACVPALIDPDGLPAANARLMMAELTGEELVGQAAGGAAFGAVASLPFLADAVSFVVSAGFLAWAVPSTAGPRSPERSLGADVSGGLRWLLGDRVMRTLAAVIGCLAACQAMVYGVLALYVTGPLRLTPAGYGFFLAVAGSGNAIGALTAGRLHRRIGGAWCVVGAAAVATAGYMVMAATSSALAAVAALTAETGAVIVGNVAVRTFRQAAAGPGMQGRAASAFQVVVLGAMPLGGLAGGLLAPAVGVRGVLVVAAALQTAVMAGMGSRLVTRVRPAATSQP